MTLPWLSVVGLGEDGLNGLAPAARALAEDAEILIGGERHLALLPELPNQTRMSWTRPLLDLVERITDYRGRRVCVLATGDPMWFGIGVTLAKRVPADEMRIFPHVSAFSLAAARMGWAVDACDCLTLHGRPLDLLGLYLQPQAKLLILSDNGQTPAQVAAFLTKRGFGSATISVLEHMGGVAERRQDGVAKNWSIADCADFNTLAVQLHDGPGLSRLAGLDDDLFLHDGNITKREIRAVTLSRLAPFAGDLLWDVGAGSGSIGIEWLRADRRNRAIAIEEREGRRGMIAQNALALGVPHLQIVAGSVPAALDGLPSPDAIFIGGGIMTDGLIARCWNALKPGGRLVANVVTLEGESKVVQARQSYGGDLGRFGVHRAEPVGRYHGWHAMMPVTQWSVTKE